MRRCIVLFVLLLLTGSAFATQMMVVGEVFSAPWCGSCPTARSALQQLAENPAVEYLIPLIWNIDTPYESPGGADRYWWYPGDGYIPWNAFGGTMLDISSSAFLSAYNTCAAVDSPLEMDLSYTVSGNVVTAQVDVEVTGNITTTTNELFFVLSTPYENEDADYINMVIDCSDDIDFTLTQVGETMSASATLTVENPWVLEECNLVAMVQSHDEDSRFILQAATVSTGNLNAAFTSDVTTGPAQLGVQFTDNSFAPLGIASWEWDFNSDGNVDSNEQNPYWLFTSQGYYAVTLTVTDPVGEQSTLTQMNYIYVTNSSDISGNVAGVWVTEHSPYNITGDVYVGEGSTLVIEPEVQVVVTNGAAIEVNGALQIQVEEDYQTGVWFHSVANDTWAGLRIRNSEEPSIIENSYFEDAVESALLIENAPVTVNTCTFVGNAATANAAGIHVVAATDVTIHGCLFEYNTSQNFAGAIGLVNSIVTASNNLIVYNTGSFAGAIGAKQGSALTMLNNTVAENTCTGSTHGHVSFFQSTGTLLNDIVRCEEGIALYNFGTAPTATYSDISGGYTGEGNIDADPLFKTNPMWALTQTSPCVDAANPDAAYNDMDSGSGSPAFPAQGTLVGDMGCFGGPNFNQLWVYAPAVGDDENPVVSACRLSAYPNPFNPVTTLALSLPETMKNRPVSLAIYNVRGERVATLLDNEISTTNTITWRGMDDSGRPVSSGVYFARMSAGGQVVTCKLALLK